MSGAPAVHLRIGVRSTACPADLGRAAVTAGQLTGDYTKVTCGPCKTTVRYKHAVEDAAERARLPLIGHDLALILGLARQLLHNGTRGHLATDLSDYGENGRGFHFDVALNDPDGQPTGRIARVQVIMDRVEQPQEVPGGPGQE